LAVVLFGPSALLMGPHFFIDKVVRVCKRAECMPAVRQHIRLTIKTVAARFRRTADW